MKVTFTTTIDKDDVKNATGICVPSDAIATLDSGKKPKVVVHINNYHYRSTVAVMGGVFMIPLSQEHRASAGVAGGDEVEVTLELDTEPRTVEVPDDLMKALSEDTTILDAFNRAAFSVRKEFVRQVLDAKTPETRQRRIAKIIEKLSSS